jgi:hypothetical protein
MKEAPQDPEKRRPAKPAGRRSEAGAPNRKAAAAGGRRTRGEPEDVTEEQDGGTMLTVAEILDFSEGTDSRP